MPDLPFDAGVAASLADDLHNMSALTDAADIDNAVKSFNNRLGIKDGEPGGLSYEDGQFKLGNDDLAIDDSLDGEALASALKKNMDPDVYNNVLKSLKDTTINPPESVQQTARDRGAAASPPQSQALRDRFPVNDINTASKQDLENAMTTLKNQLQKDAGPSIWGKIAKYTIISGLTYTALTLIANARTGCYAIYGTNKQKIVDPTITDDKTCAFIQPDSSGNMAIAAGVETKCANVCPSYIQGSAPPKTATPDQLKLLSPASCNCINDGQTTVAVPNVALSYQTPSAFDILGGILNGIGVFIDGIANDVLKVVDAGANIISDFAKIFMWVGVAAGIILVLVGVGFLAKKLHDKAKERKLKMGIAGGGRSRYKEWKRLHKKIKKSTPLSHLTLSHTWM